jgi:hypothetical protein
MLERRSSGRIPVARGVLIYCGKKRGVFAGMVREISDGGVKIQLGGLKVPRRFELSFDNFLTVQSCRMVWRDRMYVGATFDRPPERRSRAIRPQIVAAQ